MKVLKDIEKLIMPDKKNILLEIEYLKQELGIKKKFDEHIEYIDNIETIYLSNLSMDFDNIKDELEKNKDKVLELRCKINGQKKYLKGFGKAKDIDLNTIITIFRFITLIKLLKSIDEVSYYASQFYSSESIFQDKKGVLKP